MALGEFTSNCRGAEIKFRLKKPRMRRNMADNWHMIKGKIVQISDMNGNRICKSPNPIPIRNSRFGDDNAEPLTNECKHAGADEFVFYDPDRNRTDSLGLILVGFNRGYADTLYTWRGDGGILTTNQTIVGIPRDDVSDYIENINNHLDWKPRVLDFDNATQSGRFNWVTTTGHSVISSVSSSGNPVLSVSSGPVVSHVPFRFRVIGSIEDLKSIPLGSLISGRARRQRQDPEVTVDRSEGRVRIKISQC